MKAIELIFEAAVVGCLQITLSFKNSEIKGRTWQINASEASFTGLC